MAKIVKVNLDFPIVKTQDWLLEFADRVLIVDLHTRMESSKDINGESYDSLAVSTKKQRQRKGFGFDPLLATNQLKRSFKAKTFKKNSVRIAPEGTHTGGISNKRLSDILQNEGVRSKKHGLRKFDFFGISREVERDIVPWLKSKIEKAIKRGGRRTIR